MGSFSFRPSGKTASHLCLTGWFVRQWPQSFRPPSSGWSFLMDYIDISDKIY